MKIPIFPYQGFYIYDNKLIGIDVKQSLDKFPEVEAARQCCDFLNWLAIQYPKNVFATVIKWAILGPFSFIMKVNFENHMHYLHFYDALQTGKNTLADIVLYIWNLVFDESERSTHDLGFGRINTEARLGYAVSKTTYPVTVHEVGSLGDPNYSHIKEAMKRNQESKYARGKFIAKNTYEEIPALSPMFLTSNPRPPNDPGYARRFLTYDFSNSDTKTQEQVKKFNEVYLPNRKLLKTLGDFVAPYVAKNDYKYIFNGYWVEQSTKILKEFYKFACCDLPDWLDDMIDHTELEESIGDASASLHTFFINLINKSAGSAVHRDKQPADSSMANTIEENLEYCLNRDLIPYFVKKYNELIIKPDIMNEIIRSGVKIGGLATVATEIPGFRSASTKINQNDVRIVRGTITDFRKYLSKFL